jgi:hypothetical protein
MSLYRSQIHAFLPGEKYLFTDLPSRMAPAWLGEFWSRNATKGIAAITIILDCFLPLGTISPSQVNQPARFSQNNISNLITLVNRGLSNLAAGYLGQISVLVRSRFGSGLFSFSPTPTYLSFDRTLYGCGALPFVVTLESCHSVGLPFRTISGPQVRTTLKVSSIYVQRFKE